MKTQVKKMEIIAIPDPDPKIRVTLDYDVKEYLKKKEAARRASKRIPKRKKKEVKETKPVKRDPIFIEEVKIPIVRPKAQYSNRQYT